MPRPASRFFKFIYLKLFRINDAPQKIALGLGLGVFLGVFPGTGPVAALTLAFLLRVNRASALLGSILTNTWLSIPVFLVALKVGSLITGVDYWHLRDEWNILAKNFNLGGLFSISARKVVLPVLTGYFAVSLTIGVLAYGAALLAVKYIRREKKAGDVQ
jgi:uncharacterized protein (DUF2062 family)